MNNKTRAESNPTSPSGDADSNDIGSANSIKQTLARAERLNGILHAIRNVNQLITKEDDLQRLIEGACANLTETLSYHNAWIALLDDDGAVIATAQSGLDSGFAPLREHLLSGEFSDCMRRALKADQVVTINDPVSECRSCPLATSYHGRVGLTRRLAFRGKTYGILAASVPNAYADDAEEQSLFDEVAGDLAFAFHKIGMALRLSESERDLKRARKLASFGAWRFDLSTGRVIASDETRTIYGVADAELSIPYIQTVPLPPYRQVLDAALKALIEENAPYDVEFEIRRPSDGVIRCMHSVAEYDAARNIVVGSIQDITERKRAEEAVRREQIFSEAIIDSIPGTFYVLDERGGYVKWNAYQRDEIVGRPEEETAGFSAINTIHPDDRDMIGEKIANVMKHGMIETVEGRVLLSGGPAYRWLVMTGRQMVVDGKAFLVGIGIDITERKRVEEALQRKEHDLSESQRIAHVGSWRLDLATNQVVWTDELYKMYGFDSSLPPPSYIEHEKLFIPESWERLSTALAHTRDTGVPYTLELEIVRKDGSNGWMWVRGEADVDSAGQTVGLWGAAQDITERKRAEAALRASEEKFRSIFASMTEIVVLHELVCDGGGRPVNYRILDCNLAFTRITGIRREEAVGRLATDVYGSGSAPYLDHYARVAQTGEPCTFTTAYEPLNKHFDICVVSLGKNMFVTVTTDITDRKRAEESLWHSRAILRAVLDNITVRVFWKDANLNYLGCNVAFARDAGFEDPQELVGQDDFAMGWREQAERYRHDDREVIETGITRLLVPEPQTTPSGETIHLLTSKVPLRNAQGAVIGVLGTYIDVSEMKRAEEEREKLQAQLLHAQKMESVGRLAGGVAHDFNNMITGIQGYVELCQEAIARDHPAYEWLDEIMHETQRSANLTRQLLAFARKQTASPQVLDLNDVVADMLKMLRRLIGEDIDLSWQPGAEAGAVKIDPGQVDQILANLCVNARDAIEGAGKVAIMTKNVFIDADHCAKHAEATPGSYVMLAVGDTGCGMDRETLVNIFEPFFTTKGVGKGTGLGLATVYGIVRQNGGFVHVESEPGRGSTFTIYLPRHLAEAVPEPNKEPQRPHVRGHETILLVEDEPSILKMTTLRLQREGYTVLAAETPSEAIRLATEHGAELHLILSDVVMPEMNGRDLVNHILTLHPTVKSLFMSGYTADVIAHNGVLDEDVNFIQKPFSTDDLLIKVREVLETE